MPKGQAPLLLAILVVSVGCAVAPSPAPNDPTTWVANRGGLADPLYGMRADAAARRLNANGRSPIRRIFVAADDHVGAWSWSDGTIVLTQRLVRELGSDDIAAVLAHECGHLSLDAHSSRGALIGSRGVAIETAADRAGAAYLASVEIDPQSMPRMLRRVADAVGMKSMAGRAALQRAASLEAEFASKALNARSDP